MKKAGLKKRVVCFFIFVIICFVNGCGKNKYPSGICHQGQRSYQQGSLQDWQEGVRPWLAERLGMTDELAQTKEQTTPTFKFVEKNPRLLKNKTRLYHVSHSSFDGRELLGFLLLPPEDTSASAGLIQERPTLIVLHGHGRTKEDVVYDRQGTFKNVAIKAAAQGLIVFVPDQRTFGENNAGKKHRAVIRKTPQTGKFMKEQILDVMTAQHALESLDLGALGLQGKISSKDNKILGLSLGGYVALFTGALDPDFETVSVQSHFFPFEFLFTQHHCACQHIPALVGQINVTDLAMMIPPRQLKIGLGLKDAYVNGYVTSALDILAKQAAVAGVAIGEEGPIALTIDKTAGHEVVSDDVITIPASEAHH